jgi:hypothetical protein
MKIASGEGHSEPKHGAVVDTNSMTLAGLMGGAPEEVLYL